MHAHGALFCAALVVGALGVTAVASAIQGNQTISVSLRSNRAGTKAKPRRIYLLVVNPSPALRAVMVGTLKTDTGKYGRKLDVAIPPVLQNGGLPGLTITLTRFQTSAGGTFRGTPYVALRGCSGGKLNYKDFPFRDNTGVVSTKSATATGTCRSR
jgi:hypothetical protein